MPGNACGPSPEHVMPIAMYKHAIRGVYDWLITEVFDLERKPAGIASYVMRVVAVFNQRQPVQPLTDHGFGGALLTHSNSALPCMQRKEAV